MAHQPVSLDGQLSLLCTTNEGMLLSLALSALLPNAESVMPRHSSALSCWLPTRLDTEKAKFLFEPEVPFYGALPFEPLPSPIEDSHDDDNNVFLRFVDKAHELLADDFCGLVAKANEGVTAFPPLLCEQGEGGTYFLRDPNGVKIGVFKPADEDPQGENNPKKKLCVDEAHSPPVLRKTIPKGEASLREVAAFELDRGFAGVPPTRMMKAMRAGFGANDRSSASKTIDKIGSLQLFISSEADSWDLPPYHFSTIDVHRIGIFDIRSFNTDRHGGNMLAVGRDEPKHGGIYYDLVPIDHGFCFPTALSEANWEWLYWPQAKKRFDEETLAFIAAIDVEQDSQLLRRAGLSEEAVRVNRIATLLLKKGAAAGLTLFDIAKICLRKRFKDQEELSPLEQQCETSKLAAAGDMAAFWSHLEWSLATLVTKREGCSRARTCSV